MKNLLKVKLPTKEFDFMGVKAGVTVRQLSSAEVLDFQAYVKAKGETMNENDGLDIQFKLIRMAVTDAAELTDDELKSFPFPEITKLTEEILSFSGIDTARREGNV